MSADNGNGEAPTHRVWQHTCLDGSEWFNDLPACRKCGKARPEPQKVAEAPEPTRTLRDEFAMAALTGLIAQDNDPKPGGVMSLVATAYKFADAMIAAREGK